MIDKTKLSRLARNPKFVLFVVALVLRLVFIAIGPGEPISEGNDSVFFWMFAKNIAEGKGYSDANGLPEGSWNPGYAFFLAPFAFITNNNPEIAVPMILLVQAVLSALLAPLLFESAVLIFGSRLSGFIAGGLGAFLPAFIFHTKVLLSELLGIFLLTLTILFFVKLFLEKRTSTSQVVFAGCCLGVLALVRLENAVLILAGLFFGCVAFLIKGQQKNIFIACFIALVLFSPWILRNYVAFGEFMPMGMAGVLALARPGADYWTAKGEMFEIPELRAHPDPEWREYQKAKKIISDTIKKNPLIFLKGAHCAIFRFFVASHLYGVAGPSWAKNLFQAWTEGDHLQFVVRVMLILFHTGVSLLALAGIVLAFIHAKEFSPQARLTMLSLAVFVFYRLFQTIVTTKSSGLLASRYSVTIFPVLILFAAYALTKVFESYLFRVNKHLPAK